MILPVLAGSVRIFDLREVQLVITEIQALQIFLQQVKIPRAFAELVVQVPQLALLLFVQVVADHDRRLLQAESFRRQQDAVPDDDHLVRVHGDRPGPAVIAQALHQVPDLFVRVRLCVQRIRFQIIDRQPLPVFHVDFVWFHALTSGRSLCPFRAQPEIRRVWI